MHGSVPIPPHPKRKLGQNFLHDQNVIAKIIDFANPATGDCFVEIGAGTGALTQRLAPHVRKLFAIEVDPFLLAFLKRLEGVETVQADIQKIELGTLTGERRLRIIGNLPYYISTPILTSLIRQKNVITDMTLMFQEEVALRILAPTSDTEYGYLSAIVQYYCTIRRGFKISRNSFTPRPEIESRILQFRFPGDREIDYPEYSSFLAHAFSHRRKKLRNNLIRSLNLAPEKLDSVFRRLDICENTRAENLSPHQFEQLILALR